jgi:hypothetical protein
MICLVDRRAREAAPEIVARNQFPEGFSAAGGGEGAGAAPPADAGTATITGMENIRNCAVGAFGLDTRGDHEHTGARRHQHDLMFDGLSELRLSSTAARLRKSA